MSLKIPDPLDLTEQLSDVEILEGRRFASGGFGDIFVLEHKDLGPIAIKRMREVGNEASILIQRKVSFAFLKLAARHSTEAPHSKRAQKEARIWQICRHPNILPLLGIYQSNLQFCFVSPYLQNGSLSDFIQAQPGVDRLRLVRAGTHQGVSHLLRHKYAAFRGSSGSSLPSLPKDRTWRH